MDNSYRHDFIEQPMFAAENDFDILYTSHARLLCAAALCLPQPLSHPTSHSNDLLEVPRQSTLSFLTIFARQRALQACCAYKKCVSEHYSNRS